MRVLIQRVTKASVHIDGSEFSRIGHGWLVLVGVGVGDEEASALFLAQKIANLRAFADSQGKMNLSVKDIQGEILVVSQFTLYADTGNGRRPSFGQAADPKTANHLYNYFVNTLRGEQVQVATGVFQAHMQIELTNDGPVTFWMES
jgi:D-tyrosyl-tRNA(Tyr) deacylase